MCGQGQFEALLQDLAAIEDSGRENVGLDDDLQQWSQHLLNHEEQIWPQLDPVLQQMQNQGGPERQHLNAVLSGRGIGSNSWIFHRPCRKQLRCVLAPQ